MGQGSGYNTPMRWRTLAFVSLGVNLVLAAVWLNYARHSSGPGAGNAGAGESAYLRKEDAPEITFLTRDPIDSSDEAYIEASK